MCTKEMSAGQLKDRTLLMLGEIQEVHSDGDDNILATQPEVLYSFGTLPSKRGSNGVPTIADEEGGSTQYEDATMATPSPKPAAMTNSSREINRPNGEWPVHWIDPVHDSDGGHDILGEIRKTEDSCSEAYWRSYQTKADMRQLWTMLPMKSLTHRRSERLEP